MLVSAAPGRLGALMHARSPTADLKLSSMSSNCVRDRTPAVL